MTFSSRLLSVLALLLPAGCADPPSPVRKPDILLISVDTLRADRLSCYGYARPTSPNIDAIARGGVRFADVVAPSSVTAPSHMSVFTGLDPLSHGVANMSSGGAPRQLSDGARTLPEALSDAGYRTVALTDRGQLNPAMGFARGFDDYLGHEEPLRDKVKNLKAWLHLNADERPLFVFFHTYAVHAPYLPDRPFRGRFLPPGNQGEFARRFAKIVADEKQAVTLNGPGFLSPFEGQGEEDLAWISGLYDEGVASMDAQIGRLWKAWAHFRDPDNTLLVLLSDHGEEFGEHGGLDHKGPPHQELVSVPLIMRGPDLRPGVVPQLVSTTDLFATVFDYLGLATVPGQGRSRLPLLRGLEGQATPAYSQLLRTGTGETFEVVTLESLRLIRSSGPDGVRLELFDRSTDPLEAHDLSRELPLERERLLGLLDARSAEGQALALRFPTTEGAAPSAAEIEQLKGLGYLGED